LSGVSLVLVGATLYHPPPPRAALGSNVNLRVLARSRRTALGFWLILLDAGTIGAASTLLPLRLSRFGASATTVGATFIVASVITMLLSPVVGRLTDRRGAKLVVIVGLGLTAVLLALVPAPRAALPLAVLAAAALGGPVTASTIGAMSLLTDEVQRLGIAMAVSTSLFNVAWGLGEAVSAPASGSLARVTSDIVPLLVLAFARLLTLVYYYRADRAAIHGVRTDARADESELTRPGSPVGRPRCDAAGSAAPGRFP
jgi:MFS family permease